MTSTEKSWGITPAISNTLPTEAEKAATNALLEELKQQGSFESPEDTKKREVVLDDLQRILDEFVRRTARKLEPHNATLIRDARGQIFTYGSYLLGVFGPGSDIDTLACVPKYVTREEFFKSFPDILKEMAPKDAIAECTSVPEAHVPIIKFKYSGISIDLIFSRIATLTQFPPRNELNMLNDQYLRGLDEAELRSVNGTRVGNEILKLVPEVRTFRLALRAIKLWAQRRAIYASVIGFPGGIVWAMLMARVCQLYPKATSATIVTKFFYLIKRWPWPQPVVLKKMEDGPLNVRIWNPKLYKADSYHLMPVITPAYPQMCATYTITQSTKTVVNRELDRAGAISEKIMNTGSSWSELFTKHKFFTEGYKYYLAVIATSTDKEAHQIWSGRVESRVRILVSCVERHASIALAHPFNKGFSRTHKVKNEAESEKVRDGSLAYVMEEADSEDEVGDDSTLKASCTNGTVSDDNSDETKPKAEDTSTVKAEPASPQIKSIPDVKGASASLDAKAIPGVKAEATNVDMKSIPEDEKSLGSKLYTTTHYIGLGLVEGAKSLDLSYHVNEFKEDAKYNWKESKYDAKRMFISVQHVKNINLPDDVFEPGETKPTRPIKRPGASSGTGAAKKRPAPSDGNPPPPKRRQSGPQASVAAAG